MKTYISPKAQKGLPSKIHGKGLFAITDIVKGEVVAVKNGDLLTLAEVQALPFVHLHPEIQIDDDLFICPKTKDDLEDSMAYVNHSCDPNLGMRGDIVWVAMRDVQKGEELTQDYAMIDVGTRKYQFECNCGTSNCRNVITDNDWQKKELQEKYDVYMSAYIKSKLEME